MDIICTTQSYAMQIKWFCLIKKNNKCWGETDVRVSISTQLCSITTISNPGAFNHYASSAYEPNWLKSIVKFRFQKGIFREFHFGVDTPKLYKKLSLKNLLIFKKNSALAQAVQNNWFWRSIWESSRGEYSKLCHNFYLLNISWCKKTGALA